MGQKKGEEEVGMEWKMKRSRTWGGGWGGVMADGSGRLHSI